MTEQLAPASRQTHLTLLALCVGILVVARLSSVQGGQDVSIGGMRLPSLCSMRNVAGIDCAGCGLTRSFVMIMHGQWARSFGFHHLGIPIFLFVLTQLLYRLFMLRKQARAPAMLSRLADYALIGLIALCLIDWVIGMLLDG